MYLFVLFCSGELTFPRCLGLSPSGPRFRLRPPGRQHGGGLALVPAAPGAFAGTGQRSESGVQESAREAAAAGGKPGPLAFRGASELGEGVAAHGAVHTRLAAAATAGAHVAERGAAHGAGLTTIWHPGGAGGASGRLRLLAAWRLGPARAS